MTWRTVGRRFSRRASPRSGGGSPRPPSRCRSRTSRGARRHCASPSRRGRTSSTTPSSRSSGCIGWRDPGGATRGPWSCCAGPRSSIPGSSPSRASSAAWARNGTNCWSRCGICVPRASTSSPWASTCGPPPLTFRSRATTPPTSSPSCGGWGSRWAFATWRRARWCARVTTRGSRSSARRRPPDPDRAPHGHRNGPACERRSAARAAAPDAAPDAAGAALRGESGRGVRARQDRRLLPPVHRARGGDQVCLCYFGEAAVNIGVFHEALNMASVWKLPIIFCCENNRYGMGTAFERVAAVTDVVEHACSYDMAAELVNGMDAMAVYGATERAAERARKTGHPTLLEVRTYRFMGHSMSDPLHGVYRTKEEVEEQKKRDPISQLALKLKEEGALDDPALDALDAEVRAVVEAAVQFADQSPDPDLAELTSHVLVE